MTLQRETTTELTIPPLMPPVADLLIRAKAKLEQDGWQIQYGYGETGPTCALGGINRVAGKIFKETSDYSGGCYLNPFDVTIGEPKMIEAAQILAEAMRGEPVNAHDASYVVFMWNDDHEWADVSAAFDRAIKYALENNL